MDETQTKSFVSFSAIKKKEMSIWKWRWKTYEPKPKCKSKISKMQENTRVISNTSNLNNNDLGNSDNLANVKKNVVTFTPKNSARNSKQYLKNITFGTLLSIKEEYRISLKKNEKAKNSNKFHGQRMIHISSDPICTLFEKMMFCPSLISALTQLEKIHSQCKYI